ncbi:MAG: thiaminase II [Alphaproteobacteria bacterium]
MGLFERLRNDAGRDWHEYVGHEFVEGLGAGWLAPDAFKFYLKQDYLFLFHFARAYGLAAYKAETLDDMCAAAAAQRAILEIEMGLHVKYCASWGLTEPEMAAEPEHNATTAYTRFVLERGMAGDSLDLHIALAPCVVGYGVIGETLHRDTETRRLGTLYDEWIEMYAGAEYQSVRRAAEEQLDRLWARRGNEARYAALLETFRAACRLESAFWQMGLDAAPRLEGMRDAEP